MSKPGNNYSIAYLNFWVHGIAIASMLGRRGCESGTPESITVYPCRLVNVAAWMPARDPGSKEQFPAVFPIVKSVLDIQPTIDDDDVGQQRQLFDRSYLEHGTIIYMRNPIQPRAVAVSFGDH